MESAALAKGKKMFRVSKFAIYPPFAWLAISFSNCLIAPEAAHANESERELSSWTITYSGSWVSVEGEGLRPFAVVNSVTMRRNAEKYDVFFHYTNCHMCAAIDRRTAYFAVDEEKAQQIAALVDEGQIKAALERPCTLPSAGAPLNKATVRLDPPPAGYAPFGYDILLGCRSSELDEVKANLDAAIRLFSMWMSEYENQSK